MSDFKKGLIAFSPIILMLTIYLVGSIIAGDFYKIPIAVAFLLAVELLGEYKPLVANLNGSLQNIFASLSEATTEFVENQITAFNYYGTSKKTSKLKKTQNK